MSLPEKRSGELPAAACVADKLARSLCATINVYELSRATRIKVRELRGRQSNDSNRKKASNKLCQVSRERLLWPT